MEKIQPVIIDTNIVIELFKDNKEVKKACLEIRINNLSVSSITIGELYYGALNKREIPLINKHLSRFTTLPVNEDISTIFVKLMHNYCLSHKPFIGDMLIAATALYHDIHTIKDFYSISDLKLYTTVS